MEIKYLLKKVDFSLDKKELLNLKKKTNEFTNLLKEAIKKKKINAEVFIGGSFAKGTIARADDYDIDVFLRFDWKYEDLSKFLNEILKSAKLRYAKMHGSRDYFRIEEGKLTFEVVPVVKIKKVREARNVTDLSYFHVNYMKKRLNVNMKREIILLKKFCKAAKVYGAESYIQGFSGYGIECLIVNYKTFEKTLSELIRVKEDKRLIIDPERYYKKENALFELNESKIQGPIILIDPTWKERNVLSALSRETFGKFQEYALKFMKNPSERFFCLEIFDEDKFKNGLTESEEYVKIVIKTDRQEGDIAGTKMRKFSKFLISEIKRYFYVEKEEFIYEGSKEARFYMTLKSKGEVVKIGPSLERRLDVLDFKRVNKDTFEKNGFVHSRKKVNFSSKDFLKRFIQKEKNRKMKEMGISEMKIEN